MIIRRSRIAAAARAGTAACLFAASSFAIADRTELQLGLAALDFNYEEFSQSGALLDREDGILPGVVFALAHTGPRWRISGEWRRFQGTADYTGQTNLGVPITTETGERIDTFSLRFARRLEIAGWLVAPFLGYSYHEWRRDIRSTRTASGAPVSGLYEVYSWKTLELGVLAHVVSWGRLEGGVDLRAFRVRDPEVAVRFPNGFDDAKLALGERSGGRIGVLFDYPFEPRLRARLELYHERWAFGRSATQPLTSGGTVIGTVTEPRSETRNAGLALSFVRSF